MNEPPNDAWLSATPASASGHLHFLRCELGVLICLFVPDFVETLKLCESAGPTQNSGIRDTAESWESSLEIAVLSEEMADDLLDTEQLTREALRLIPGYDHRVEGDEEQEAAREAA